MSNCCSKIKMDVFEIDYFKNKSPDLVVSTSTIKEETSVYCPYQIENIQNYHPLYSEFFELNPANSKTICLNHLYHIVDLETVKNRISGHLSKVPIFIKFSPLLDPIHYMIGKYSEYGEKTTMLPKYSEHCKNNEVIPKMASIYNASYIDNFFYYLTSQMLHTHNFIHGLDYYGSFLGIQEKYRIDVIDDIDYLNDSSYFKKNRGSLFDIENHMDPFSNFGSRGNKNKLEIGVDDCILELDSFDEEKEVSDNIEDTIEGTIEEIYEKKSNSSISSSSLHSTSSSNSSFNDSSEEEDNNTEHDDNIIDNNDSESDKDCEDDFTKSEESEEHVVYAYINNFPIQMICLEKCENTFDSLLIKGELGKKEYASILLQVIMILITYQKCFRFTHNDLHTNNIMYSNTDKKFIEYIYDGKSYRVPTYGRIFKIIDFGRAIYTFRGKVLSSDSFLKGGDAHTQYNCDPFLDENKKRIEPNPSFDLCRLGCSIYDFILDEDTDLSDIDEFQHTILRWCTDDRGKNILYKKNGEDRYPDFKLYKMIARTVHAHTPEAQLTYPFFSQFQLKGKKEKEKEKEKNQIISINIDEIPIYV